MNTQNDSADSSQQPEGTLHSLDALLAIVATEVNEPGHAFLFSGDRLRLDLPIVQVGEGKMKWGQAAHHSWAFEATLLRFARSHDPARLLIVYGQGPEPKVDGWVLGHSKVSFWAARIPHDQAKSMLAHLQVAVS